MDVLSEIFDAAKIQSASTVRWELNLPWGLQVTPPVRNMGFYVGILEGTSYLQIGDSDDRNNERNEFIWLSEGDFVILPDSTPHTLRSDPTEAVVKVEQFVPVYPPERHCIVQQEPNDAQQTKFITGCFVYERTLALPFLSVLPNVLHLQAENQMVQWLERTLQLLGDETAWGYPGYEVALSRLSDLLLIQAMRAYTAQLQEKAIVSPNWLHGLADAELAKALQLIHERVDEAWTVEKLARAIGLSRSAFAERFAAVIGLPPMEYVKRWRMHKACMLLKEDTLSVSDVAARVGYASEPSFRRAFHREIGMSIGAYLREHQQKRVNA